MVILHRLGFAFLATKNTAAFLKENGIPATLVHKVSEHGTPHIMEAIENGSVGLILNLPRRRVSKSTSESSDITDGYAIRRKAVDFGIPLITNRQLAEAFVNALAKNRNGFMKVKAWDEYGS
jgi:carbamoyl-phosphate synthase large subunit